MENKKKVSVILLVLAVLIGGAYFLYDRLSDSVDMPLPQTSRQPAPQESGSAEKTTSSEQSETGEEAGAGQQEQAGIQAPDFTVYDGAGEPVKLSDFRGKPVVLNFWSSRCDPCKAEMPDFERTHNAYADQVHFMMINVTDGFWDTLDSASVFAAESGYTFPVYYDTDVEASVLYGASSLPITFFIDAQGYPVAYGAGTMSEQMLKTGMEMAGVRIDEEE